MYSTLHVSINKPAKNQTNIWTGSFIGTHKLVLQRYNLNNKFNLFLSDAQIV